MPTTDHSTIYTSTETTSWAYMSRYNAHVGKYLTRPQSGYKAIFTALLISFTNKWAEQRNT